MASVAPEEDDDGVESEEDDQMNPHGELPSAKEASQYQGYGSLNFQNATTCQPPAPAPPPVPKKEDQCFNHEVSELDETACREAMFQFVAEHCCYGKGTAKEMTITKITPMTSHDVKLETYGEARSTKMDFDPYPGGPVDGPENGPPPGPWDIPIVPSKLFVNETLTCEVPHTSVIKPCYRCGASGTLPCTRCHQTGRVRCWSCNGRGRKRVYRPAKQGGSYYTSCGRCRGSGRVTCTRCGGDGRVTCPTCKGYRNLRHYVRLTVVFTNHVDDYIDERTDMPDELIRTVGGVILFEQEAPRVPPILYFALQSINQNSQRLVQKHAVAFAGERLLMQRQTLRAVPVTEADYQWKDLKTRFWVFGNERKVHAPDYPQTCCWGCQIL